MSYRTEFPDFVLDVEIPAGFEDHSWHNDAMPHFVKDIGLGRELWVWVDYADRSLSEVPQLPRFIAEIQKDDEQIEVITSDQWSDILTFIDEHPVWSRRFEVLWGGENVWTIDGEPLTFETFEEASAELKEHFADMDDAQMDYHPSEYEIQETKNEK